MRSLRSKIGLGYFVIIVINILIAVFAVYHINQLSTPINEILKDKYQNLNAAENMSQALQQLEMVQFEMLETSYDSLLISRFNTYKNEFFNWHQRAIEGIALPNEPVILDSLWDTFHVYLKYSEELQELLRNKASYKRAKTNHINKVLPLVQNISDLCDRLKAVNEAAIADADVKTEKLSGRANFVIIIFAIAAILISIIASIYFTEKILKPVRSTTETVRKISKGQLNQKIKILSDDEIAELGIEFNKMTKRLDEYEQLNIKQILLEKRKAEAIVNNIPVLIVVCDNQNHLVLANDYALKLFNIEDKAWQGKPISELIREKNLTALFSSLHQQYSKSEFDPNLSIFSQQTDSKTKYYFTRQVPIFDEQGRQTNIVTLMQDVTSFKNLDKLKSEFLSTISHEIKTPVTSVNMIVDILLKEIKGKLNPDQQDLLKDAQQDISRLQKLIKELLDLSKLESGKIDMDLQPVDIEEIINQAIQQLKFLADQKDQMIIKHVEKNLPDCLGNSEQLIKVLSNIIKNAIQYSPRKSEINIQAKQAENFIQFSISDSGIGISKESLEVIFDKFVQIKEFKDADKGNVGLGLAISKEIVRAHHGNIWVESEIGKGSTFYFTVPIVD